MAITEAVARTLLAQSEPLTYDEVDEVFTAFGFSSDCDGVRFTYYHKKYDAGVFRAAPKYEGSTITETQRGIIQQMIHRVIQQRTLWEEG